MGLIKTIKKGVIAARMATETNELNETRIRVLINEFADSKKYKLMQIGERYYEGENDILTKERSKQKRWDVADVRIAHPKYKNIVDEKVSYLLSKPYSLTHDDEEYLKKVQEVLGKKFQYTLFKMGFEASNKGIGWLQVYIDENGDFKTMIIPAEQCIPVWKDNSHEELECMIRAFTEVVWQGNTRVQVQSVEVWTADDVKYYRLTNDLLVLDSTKSLDEYNGPVSHFKRGSQWANWGKVPFVPFKNNILEFPDIKFIKSELDNYDDSRSEAANYVTDAVNYLMIVYGYGGTETKKLKDNIHDLRMILLPDKEDGGLEIATPNTTISAIKDHYEQLKRDIYEDAQSINKDLDKFGSAPSGVALQFTYSDLDLKAKAMGMEFQEAFDKLQYFVNTYLQLKNNQTSEEDITIVYNVDMKTDEASIIANCVNSKDVISEETILANHPWVENPEEELKKLKKEREENNPFKDMVPLSGEDPLDGQED